MSIRAITFASLTLCSLCLVIFRDSSGGEKSPEDASLAVSLSAASPHWATLTPTHGRKIGGEGYPSPPARFSPEVEAELAKLPSACGGSLPAILQDTEPLSLFTEDTYPIQQVAYQQPVSHGGHAPPESLLLRASDSYAHQSEVLPPGTPGDLPNRPEVVQYAIDQAHADCYVDDPFPSATKCMTCHPGHFREWSASPHAYAQLSPVFNTMYNKLNILNNGTLGDFCIRCHTPAGLAMGEPLVMSNMDRHPTSREGVTCVVCHRINQNWGKGAGRQALVVGGLNAPVYGPLGGEILSEVLAQPDRYGVLKTVPDLATRGRDIHGEVVPFFALTTPAFCGACHDVFAPNGFRLEDAFSEFKSSPAAREKNQTCQDCHMGVQQGVASGYAHAPAAMVNDVATPARKRTNHMIMGPDYSIVHPGLFPHNPDAVREEHPQYEAVSGYTGLATMREWLLYDYRAGWGTPEFELNIPEGYVFPEAWQDQGRRFRARDILNDQFKLLHESNVVRHQVLSAGYKLGNIELTQVDQDGIDFRILVYNGTDGHGVPTGFDAERLVFLRVTVVDRDGRPVFISGDLDPNGDVRDSHSFYVHNGELPLDRQLFSLQTRFITRNIRGGEREQILNVPYSLDPLPFTRPETRPFTVLGRPLGARKHKQNLEANGGERFADFHIDTANLTCNGPYHAQVQIIAGMVPVNLVHEISAAGFDYGLSPREVADAVVAGHMVIHSREAVFRVHEKNE